MKTLGFLLVLVIFLFLAIGALFNPILIVPALFLSIWYVAKTDVDRERENRAYDLKHNACRREPS